MKNELRKEIEKLELKRYNLIVKERAKTLFDLNNTKDVNIIMKMVDEIEKLRLLINKKVGFEKWKIRN